MIRQIVPEIVLSTEKKRAGRNDRTEKSIMLTSLMRSLLSETYPAPWVYCIDWTVKNDSPNMGFSQGKAILC